MGLNKAKGKMYGFITHTWNTIKGKCYHDCSYCYMKRFKNQKSVRFDEKELKTDLGNNNFIFVIQEIFPFQVNIGADSGNNHLSEPPKEKVLQLIKELQRFTKVYLKPNLNRIIK